MSKISQHPSCFIFRNFKNHLLFGSLRVSTQQFLPTSRKRLQNEGHGQRARRSFAFERTADKNHLSDGDTEHSMNSFLRSKPSVPR